ncbi:MAG TPA: DUF2723 domain-containing protein [Bryobacteraceae bacterium]
MTRLMFRSRYLYDIDSVNFALALGRFDPSVHQPHPPGYFLYVMLGRLVNVMASDANLAFVLISVAASCGTVAVLYLLTLEWFGRGPARFAALLFLLSPLAWFHGTVALTYVVECFFSTLIGYLCWRLIQGKGYSAWVAVVLGIAAGFRPSSILLLGPLCLYAIFVRRRRELFPGAVALSVSCAAWFVPMVLVTGGFRVYFQSLVELWKVAGGHDTVLTSPLALSFARLLTILGIACLCFGLASMFSFGTPRNRSLDERLRARFTAVWIGPGLLFFTLVFLRFINSGYLLFLSPPLFAYLGRNIFDWWNRGESPRRLRAIGLAGIAGANVAIFLFAPIYCSYRSVRQFESQLVAYNAAVRRVGSPETTMLIGFDSHFLGYRHAAYYLPEYLTVQFPVVKMGSRVGVFAARDRHTRFLEGLSRSQFKQFILLPLPREEGYLTYLRGIYRRFPAGRLTFNTVAGWSLASGSIQDLEYLFPGS